MKNLRLLFLGLIFFLPIIFSHSTLFAEEMNAQGLDLLKWKAIEIKAKNPDIKESTLQQDIKFLKKNFQKTSFAKMNLPYDTLVNVTADAWTDARIRNTIEPTTSLKSVTVFVRYGILRVNSDPKGAVIILNRSDTWDKKTNAYKGVLSGPYLVEVKLEGFLADPQNVVVPEGGDVSADFKLKKKY
jgi:hypothetical protein